MKKLVLMFAAVAAISFASCGGENKGGETVDSTADSTAATEVVDSTADSTATADSAAAPAADSTAEAAPADSAK